MSRRVIDFDEDTLDLLHSIMVARGFPKKKISESQVIAEAIELLYKSISRSSRKKVANRSKKEER